MTDDDVMALADRIVASTDRGNEFCQGVHAMAAAIVRGLTPPEDQALLYHPHAGLLVRCRRRPVDLLVLRVEGGVGPYGQGTTVHVQATAHRGADGHGARHGSHLNRRHALRLHTWRRWVTGGRILARARMTDTDTRAAQSPGGDPPP